MTALIIEDEAPAARRLKKLIEEVEPEITILGIIESVEAAVRWISSNPSPDVYFMDIQLADGVSFEIFQKVKVNAPIIFTTAFDEYALKAFKVNSIDYLLKPVQAHELSQSILKYQELVGTSKSMDRGEALQKLLEDYKINKKEYKTRFLVKLGERLIPIDTSDIIYFKSEDKLTFIFSKNGNKNLIEHTLDNLEKMLDPVHFFRLNRQYIAHISSIDTIHNYFNGKLKLFLKNKTKEEVIISRDKAPLFKEWLGQ
ncbi:MAG TPA: LytTR family DNA-binding domain-containing protein [Cytophagales bacterium]|nr:LytTR family DNA-binding domain-containing protein [Cytophagales bacterium]